MQSVIVAFGGDQFGDDESERAKQSSFFNLACRRHAAGVGADRPRLSTRLRILALLAVLAVELFVAGTGAYRRNQPPGGSPLTSIARVVVAAVRKRRVEAPDDAALLHEFLDKAAVETAGDKGVLPASPWRLCTVTQVEELKCVLRLLPVFACGIIFAAADTQISSTFILQGDTLDPRLGSFRVPAAMLSMFDTLSVMIWVPLYDRAIVPLARRLTGHTRGFTELARIGTGFVLLTIAMLLAGALEVAAAASSRSMAPTSARTARRTCRCRSSGRCHSSWWWARQRCLRSSGKWSCTTARRQTPCGAFARGSPARSSLWETTPAQRSWSLWCVPRRGAGALDGSLTTSTTDTWITSSGCSPFFALATSAPTCSSRGGTNTRKPRIELGDH
ncbi:hypothetical protein ACQ4PT_067879 [Festuca glaucescens]